MAGAASSASLESRPRLVVAASKMLVGDGDLEVLVLLRSAATLRRATSLALFSRTGELWWAVAAMASDASALGGGFIIFWNLLWLLCLLCGLNDFQPTAA